MMTLRGKEPSPTDIEHHKHPDHLGTILRNISSRIATDMIGVYTFDYTSERLTAVKTVAQDGGTAMSEDVLSPWIRTQADTLCSETRPAARVVSLDENTCGNVRSAIVWPIAIYEDLLGVVALLSYQPGHFCDDDIGPLAVWVETARMILENDHLRKHLATAEATTIAARAIVHQPSLQNIIHILRDHPSVRAFPVVW